MDRRCGTNLVRCCESFKTRGMAHVGGVIIVGTYEEFVLGFSFQPGETGSKFSLKQTFATQTHGASVRALAVGGKFLASGGADETIQLYDLSEQVTCGSLTHHNGTVNTLAFSSDRSFLLSGGDDGVIAVVQTGSWFVEKLWKSAHHGKAVTGLSVHPSGKLALSIGMDNRIITWDLIKGRRAFVTNASDRCKNGWGLGEVQWSPGGMYYAVFMSSHVEVYSVSTAAMSCITCGNRVTSMCFISDDILLVGEETGEVSIHKIESFSDSHKDNLHQEIIRFQAHDHRVKCLKNIRNAQNVSHFVSACSKGLIKIWEWKDADVTSIAEVDCECRVTCIEFAQTSEQTTNIKMEPSRVNENCKTQAVNGKSRKHFHPKTKAEEVTDSSGDSVDVSSIKRRKTNSRRLKQSSKFVIKENPPNCLSSSIPLNVKFVNSINAGSWNVSS